MGLLGINGTGGNQEISPASGKQKTETINFTPKPISIMTEQDGIGRVKQTINDKYKEFDNSVNNSVLGGKFLSEKDLFKQGFTKSKFMDMNGGVYYEKNGESIRVMNPRLFGEGKSLTYKNKNMSHFVTYDDRGKETGGIVQIKQPDGTIKVYKYDVDIEGNKFIKSVKTSEYDYFAEYE